MLKGPIFGVPLDFRREQGKRGFILFSCLVGVAQRLVGDGVEKRLRKDGTAATATTTCNRVGVERIQEGQRLARIVPEYWNDQLLPSDAPLRVKPAASLTKDLFRQARLPFPHFLNERLVHPCGREVRRDRQDLIEYRVCVFVSASADESLG